MLIMILIDTWHVSRLRMIEAWLVQYQRRGINVDGSKPLTGLIVLSIGGFCFGMLTPLFFIATSALPTTDYWRILPEGCAPLTLQLCCLINRMLAVRWRTALWT